MYLRTSRASAQGLTSSMGGSSSGHIGEAKPAPAPAPAPDTIGRIIKRGFELIQPTDPVMLTWGVTKQRQQRIRCMLALLSRPDTDDRFLTFQSVLDYANNVYDAPYFSRAKQWLLPEHEIKIGHRVTDQEIRHRLVNNIEGQIEECRRNIKRRYEQMGDTIEIRVQRANEWIRNQQNNLRSIYSCYRP
jgi:hypothetical protein